MFHSRCPALMGLIVLISLATPVPATTVVPTATVARWTIATELAFGNGAPYAARSPDLYNVLPTPVQCRLTGKSCGAAHRR